MRVYDHRLTSDDLNFARYRFGSPSGSASLGGAGGTFFLDMLAATSQPIPVCRKGVRNLFHSSGSKKVPDTFSLPNAGRSSIAWPVCWSPWFGKLVVSDRESDLVPGREHPHGDVRVGRRIELVVLYQHHGGVGERPPAVR